MKFTNKTLLTIVSAAGLSLAAACSSSGGSISVTCVSGPNDGCTVATVSYDSIAGGGAVTDAAIQGYVEGQVCGFIDMTVAADGYACPADLDTGTVLGTCDIEVVSTETCDTGCDGEVVNITAVSGTTTINDSNGMVVGDAETYCNDLEDLSDATTTVTTTWTAAP